MGSILDLRFEGPGSAVTFDYSRGRRQMSLRRIPDFLIATINLLIRRALLPLLFLLGAISANGQYPGQVSSNTKEAPVLRSIGVLEWTGPEEKPKASRLVPVLVYDNGKLEDGSIYLARPEPMAVAPEVEYELQENGKPVGLYDVQTAGQQLGSWVGFGAWKPIPSAPRNPPKPTLPEWGMDNQEGDHPILHRKKHPDEASSSGSSSSGQASGDQTPAAPSDPDRPVLHKSKSADSDDSSASGSSTGASSGSSTPSTSSSGTSDDPDRPVLHKKDSDSDSTASSSTSTDPDRPVLHKNKKAPPSDVGPVSSVAGDEDPDRPRLKRGLANMDGLKLLPSLVGLPPDIEQSVAVSDARHRPEHPFAFTWADPAVEAKLKSSLEDIARSALGLNSPAVAPKAKTTTAAVRKTAKPAPLPVDPPPLMEEHFRAFELTYGSEATLVLTAHTDAPPSQQKFVTLVAQPDFYGNVQVLLKTVTDAAHLDDNPRLRLVDAVDALADNRGELLFEMRGATERQFALYRIARGQAEKLFVTGGGQFGADPNN
jgi:hypothetical protein